MEVAKAAQPCRGQHETPGLEQDAPVIIEVVGVHYMSQTEFVCYSSLVDPMAPPSNGRQIGSVTGVSALNRGSLRKSASTGRPTPASS